MLISNVPGNDWREEREKLKQTRHIVLLCLYFPHRTNIVWIEKKKSLSSTFFKLYTRAVEKGNTVVDLSKEKWGTSTTAGPFRNRIKLAAFTSTYNNNNNSEKNSINAKKHLGEKTRDRDQFIFVCLPFASDFLFLMWWREGVCVCVNVREQEHMSTSLEKGR